MFANVVVRRLSMFVNSFLSIKKEKRKEKKNKDGR
jgi:hypothetical protein